MQFVTEKNVPIPRKSGRQFAECPLGMHMGTMNPGDSVHVPFEFVRGVKNPPQFIRNRAYSVWGTGSSVIRSLPDGSLRVWYKS